MRFVRAVWKLLVGIKDALVLILLLLFFGGLYAALSSRPAPISRRSEPDGCHGPQSWIRRGVHLF